jgi:putative FmdB family regulatory protein
VFGAVEPTLVEYYNLRVESSSAEVVMPLYEYTCKECHKNFSTVLTIDKHEHRKVTCPKCGSKRVEQQFSAFYAVTSHKS